MTERRRSDRQPAGVSCLATFEHRGRTFRALVMDHSEQGIGLLVNTPATGLALRAGEVLEVQLASAGTTWTHRGRVIWVDAVTGGRRFGIQLCDEGS